MLSNGHDWFSQSKSLYLGTLTMMVRLGLLPGRSITGQP
jgi:hypothetical protein